MNDLIERAARRMLLERAKRNLAAQGIHGTDDGMIGEPPETSMAVAREDVRSVLRVLTYAEAKTFRDAKGAARETMQ